MIRRKVLTIDGATDIAALLDQHRGPYLLGKTSNPVYLLLSEQPATAWQTHAWKHSDGVKVASIEAAREGSRLALDLRWIEEAEGVMQSILEAIGKP